MIAFTGRRAVAGACRSQRGRGRVFGWTLLLPGLFVLFPGFAAAQDGKVRFTEVAASVGALAEHGFTQRGFSEHRAVSGGVAAGDYNGDGWVDLYVIRGSQAPNALLQNLGNGYFRDVGELAGVAVQDLTSGPSFFDFDGDGRLDLLVGAIEAAPPRLFRNMDGQVFADVTESAHIVGPFNTLGHAAGDYDRDGDLDLFVARWGTPEDPEKASSEVGHLWRNEGDGTFVVVRDTESGLDFFTSDDYFSFAPNFADINGDGWLDIVVTSDFQTSRVFLNDRDGTFTNATDPDVITDENGMGSAIGDYDRDGDLDWFVTSIWDPNGEAEGNWGITGNRLYSNRGDGTFEDVTTQAGVRQGFWGWGACFADFNNDGYPDIFHVNGFPMTEEFSDDPSRLFLNNADGTFTEQSMASGIEDRGQGRGLVCFDYDRDGDVDIFIANNTGLTRLYRNDSDLSNHFLNLTLRSPGPNTQGVGAKISVTAGGLTQTEELRLHCNYVSHEPGELHFGLGAAERVDELTVQWPDGGTDVYRNLDADQFFIARPGQIDVSNARACVDGSSSMCLQAGRFEVSATFKTPDGATIAGQVRTLGDGGKAGYLWFTDPDNPEVVVKVLDACIFGGRYWLFAGGLTNVEVDLRIRDAKTGEVRSFTTAPGTPFPPIQDTGSFATCAEVGPPSP